MQVTSHIMLPYADITAFCQRWHVSEFSLFGSVLRDDFTPESDIDVLVVFSEKYTLDTLLDMKDELEVLFGREVDLIVKKAVEADPNYLRRKIILDSAQVIYGRKRCASTAAI